MFTNLCRGERVCLDRRFQLVHPYLPLNPPHGVSHDPDINDGGDVVVVRHPALELFVQRLGGVLTDADDCCADLSQPTYEVPLRRWKERLDEDHVHLGMLPTRAPGDVPSWVGPPR
jgi:hypothetical protein